MCLCVCYCVFVYVCLFGMFVHVSVSVFVLCVFVCMCICMCMYVRVLVSLSTLVCLIVGINKEMYGFCKMHLDKQPYNSACQKTGHINAKNAFKMPNTHFKSQVYRI